MSDLNVGFINARGLADRKKRVDVFAWLKNKSCDIVCLADTHSSGVTEKNFSEDWGSDSFFNLFTSASRGVAVYSKKN